MTEPLLFFLPDISGFTSFVQENEIEHSQHIISELLDLIIASDQLEMTVAEIEGDAVFFYKQGQLPNATTVLEQAEHIFIKFHQHLKQYENQRICDCGACTSAVNLSLKFVAYWGEAGFIQAGDKPKPFGEDVIKAHRLLKNSTPYDEYVLLCNCETISVSNGTIEGKDNYENIGTIEYEHKPLDALKNSIPPIEALTYPNLSKKPDHFSIEINSSKAVVYELLSNMNKRKLWNKDVDFKYNKKEVNRVGSKHVCIIGNNTIEFETVTHDFGKDKLVFGERSNEVPLVKEATTYFILEGDENKTKLSVEVHFLSSTIKQWLFNLLIHKKLTSGLIDALKRIKSIAEQQ